MRTPGLSQFAQFLLAWLAFQPKQFADFDLNREVAGRPNVAAPFRKQQVDFCLPAADALDLDKLGDRFFVVLGQIGEI